MACAADMPPLRRDRGVKFIPRDGEALVSATRALTARFRTAAGRGLRPDWSGKRYPEGDAACTKRWNRTCKGSAGPETDTRSAMRGTTPVSAYLNLRSCSSTTDPPTRTSEVRNSRTLPGRAQIRKLTARRPNVRIVVTSVAMVSVRDGGAAIARRSARAATEDGRGAERKGAPVARRAS